MVGPTAERWPRYLDLLIAAIVAHSLAVGIALLLAPAWSAAFGGWEPLTTMFFTRQAGAFHFVVAFGYAHAWWRHRSVTLLVVTKAIATVFLLAVWALGETAWSVPFSGVADGAMGLLVAWAHRRVGDRAA